MHGALPASKAIQELSAAAFWSHTRFYTSNETAESTNRFLGEDGIPYTSSFFFAGLEGPWGIVNRSGKTAKDVLRSVVDDRAGYYLLRVALLEEGLSFKELEIRVNRPGLEVQGGMLSDKLIKPSSWISQP